MTGLDTETHKGRVVLIATPRDHLELWRYPSREQWHVLIEWLKMQDTRFCCWNADYDIQAILTRLCHATNEDLWKLTRVDYGRYRIRYVPSKFFTVGIIHGKKKESKTLFTVYDLMQFYASSLEKAARKVLGRGKQSAGVSWQDLLSTMQRGTERARGQILTYCRDDAALVEEMYSHSKTQFDQAGVNFDKPISCASIAIQKFSKVMGHDVPKEINHTFERTYRGGRIECLKVGFFPKAYLYDIHSAYPSVMAGLSETRGATFSKVDIVPRADAVYAAMLVKLAVGQGQYRCPVAVLGDTQLMYPAGAWSQWVDLDTYRLLESQDMIQKVVKGWQLVNTSDTKPFSELSNLYFERQRHPEQSWALKVIMNALYGKVAQRIKKWVRSPHVDRDAEAWRGEFWTRREQWTKRTNFVYASAITSRIRKRLYLEIPPENCIFYATDGVMTTVPIRVNSGSGIGEWSEAEPVFDLCVVGSGVYTYREASGTVRTKLRGFEVGLDLYELLDRRRRILTLTVKRNWTLAQVMRQHKYSHFNELVDVPRYLDVCFDRKRIWDTPVRMGRDLLKRNYDSKPWTYYPGVTYEEF